jgi:hypothetical protein
MAKRKIPPSHEMILADHSPEVRRLVESLRNMIRETVPAAVETVYLGWHGLGYHHPEGGYFCAIFPETARVRLAFEWGVLLPDPHHLLHGKGRQVRYVEIYQDEDLQEPAIRDLLLAAVNLPGDRAFKLALIRQSAKPAKLEGE